MTVDQAEELHLLQRKWEGLTDVPERPRSTMDVIEYGLGKQRRAEVYVNRLLCYLLDPNQPHRLESDFLETFLERLPEACGFDEDTFDLSDIRVSQQLPVWADPAHERDDEASPGYLDLLLEVPNEWFLLIELKFSAAETGTDFYCTASQIGERLVSDYESGQYYLYLHQANQPKARGECFVNWSWQAFVDDVLDEFIAENAPRYPQRTATQLHDLRDDIRHIAGMSEQSESDRQKVALYVEHADAIADVTSTFEDKWEDYSTRWGRAMEDSLQHPAVSPASDPNEEFTTLDVQREDGDDERWILFDSGGDWQHVFKHGWRRREESDETLVHRADDTNDLRIGFYHRMGSGSNRETAVRDRTLRFNFRCMGSNPTEFNSIFETHFNERKGTIEELLGGTNAETTGEKLTSIRGTYPIDLEGHEDIFAAYTAALNEAFIDLVVERPGLIELLSEEFESSIRDYR